MKKLIAILVVFAMVATVAFAETTVSGAVEVRWTIAGGNSGDNTDVVTAGEIYAGTVGFSGANDDGTFGGRLQFVFEGASGPNYNTPVGNIKWDHAYAWWQPIEQVRFFLGQDGDGMFNTANLSRWGHHRMPRGVSVENWDAGNYLIGNWDNFGMALIIKPIDGLAINLATIIPGVNSGNFPGSASAATAVHGTGVEGDILTGVEHEDWFKSLQAQVSYALDGVGTFYLTYRGEYNRDPGNRLGLTYFANSLVDGLQFEVGGNYDLADNALNPLRIGVGVHFGMDAFGIRFRAFMNPREAVSGDWLFLKMDLMPFYTFDFGTIYCNIRVETRVDEKINFHINPYFRFAMGGGDFRVGLLVAGNTVDNSVVTWRLPISMLVAF